MMTVTAIGCWKCSADQLMKKDGVSEDQSTARLVHALAATKGKDNRTEGKAKRGPTSDSSCCRRDEPEWEDQVHDMTPLADVMWWCGVVWCGDVVGQL